jgi:hypothetical protein
MAINITAKGDPEKKLKWAFKMVCLFPFFKFPKTILFFVFT